MIGILSRTHLSQYQLKLKSHMMKKLEGRSLTKPAVKS